MTAGQMQLTIVDVDNGYQLVTVNFGDIWYFPQGVPHAIQGLDPNGSEFVLVFDQANFDAVGTTFHVDDWITHAPKSVLAKNFGVNSSVFENVTSPNPYILNGTDQNAFNISSTKYAEAVSSTSNSSHVYRTLQNPPLEIGGGTAGGSFYKVDSTVFPMAKNIASAYVILKPGALRELHWHPNVSHS